MNRLTSPVRALAVAATIACALGADARAAAAQRPLEGAVTLGRAEHRVDFGYGIEAATGTLLGATVRAHFAGTLEIDASARGGSLRTEAGTDRTMGEIGVRAGITPMEWVTAFAVATVRGYEVTPATQRWTQVGAGVELRSGFAGGAVQGIVRGTLFPHVAVSGIPSPDLGVSAGVGLSARRGRLLGGLEYGVDRYSFPAAADGTQRHEQLAGLTLSVGAAW